MRRGIWWLSLALCVFGARSKAEENDSSTATPTIVVTSSGIPESVDGVFTPDPRLILCQDDRETAIEELERQEQGVRDAEKAAVGLEIAQGALEITLGAVRIAAAGTTAEVLRREDNVAISRASLGPGNGIDNTPPPDVLGPIFRDADDLELKKQICAHQREKDARDHKADDPFHKWTEGFHARIRRYSGFADMLQYTRPTPDPRRSSGGPVNLPSVEEAERLLKLLENLLDTNNRVLQLLGMDLPPITNSGAFILRQYKERIGRRKHAVARYGARGYMDEEDYEEATNDKTPSRSLNGDRHWIHSSIDREEPVKTFSDELARLKRIRKVSQYSYRRKL